MRLQEAADILGVHYQTAYGWVRGGKLPARLVAGGYDVAEPDVQAFLVQRRLGRKPASEIQVRDWPARQASCTRRSGPGKRRRPSGCLTG